MSQSASWIKDAIDLVPKAWALAKATSKAVGDRASYDFRTAHTAYCISVVEKYCRARTFFIRDDPKFLEDFYVPASIIVSGHKRVPQAELFNLEKVARRTILMGSGGSGKTVFMRHLLLDAIQKGNKYPVFIELRKLNEVGAVDLEAEVVNFMLEHKFPLDKEFARQSLYDGLLVVLLDGFDEVVADKRRHLEREIKKLGVKSASQVVVSSRHDSMLDGWENFHTVSIAPLELDEACELIERIPFHAEEEVKHRFIKRLREGLFDTHEHFLSNPLLLSIMLLTYGDSADIPNKFSSFYDQAYGALYQKHDAFKSGYRRERQVQLDILDFGRLFAAFSAVTFDKRVSKFTLEEGVKYVDAAKRVAGLEGVSSVGFLEDSRQAVCLLIEDGLELAYVHRSFQEYFVARFIAGSDSEMKQRFVEKLISGTEQGYQGDNVFQLLYEMIPSLVEDQYLLPVARSFFGSTLNRKMTKKSWRELFQKLFSHVCVSSPDSVSYTIASRRNLAALLFIRRNCCADKRVPLRSRQDLYDVISSGLGEGVSRRTLKSIGPRSSIWGDIDDHAMSFSAAGLEKLRLAVLDIERSSMDRASAISDVFDVG